MKAFVLAALFLGATSTGCLGDDVSRASSAAFILTSSESRVPVIAVLDSGATPYLPVFREPAVGYVSSHIQTSQISVNISENGTLEQDWNTWESLLPNQLYSFTGSRMLAISMIEGSELPPIVDDAGHGTGTTYLAARESPTAILVLVQVDLSICSATESCIADPSVADGMEWIAEQPWIDIVSISIALPGNIPDPPELHPDAVRFLVASERAASRGKLILNAAGNEVVPTLADYFAGPPWIVAVGGVQSDRKGESIFAGKGIDVVANFTEAVPTGDDGQLDWSAGTSLGTPIVAGVLGSALQKIWAADPNYVINSEQLRHALNSTAASFAVTEWDPTPTIRGTEPDVYASATAPVVGPSQIGWGYVDGSIADEIAHRVLQQDLAPPTGKTATAAFQSHWQNLREDFWTQDQ